ncbi:MAG TPA: PIG-L family deacetylase, partial [Terriglobia bacterium]|nr:PIG-L family deacetylase [Terriglobia bacterium]
MPKDSSAAWRIRHQRWLRFVQANIRAMNSGKTIRPGPSARPLEAPAVKAGKGPPIKVVVCSPHPDDEALVGALPLRLRRECGAEVTNFAITLGRKPGQRARRLREMRASCEVLGFNWVVVKPHGGFDHVDLDNRKNHPEEWADKVNLLSEVLEKERPDAVFAPHAEDCNSTHMGTHFLVADALGDYLERTGRGPLAYFETEYWHQNYCPNLMVGVSPEDEAILIMATAEHGGEVRRNPYHLRHPGRMIENVRRGAEVVGGQGAAAPDFPFAELYRLVFIAG